MNKADLINQVAKKADLTKNQASDVLNAFTDIVTTTLAKGEKVTLMGFGSWEVRQRAARTGRNPQTGKTIKIKAKKVPKFNAGKELKKAVEK